jgi:hypothetical protein
MSEKGNERDEVLHWYVVIHQQWEKLAKNIADHEN